MEADIKIVDTTLRDGEQKAGIALGLKEKVRIAKVLDSIGIYQIEAGIPAMGGEEKKSVQKIAELGLKSRVSAWNRLKLEDIRQSMETGAQIIHISVPSSNIQLYLKLRKDKDWVIDNLKRCVSYCREKGFEVTVGLEDASRADFSFLLQLVSAAFLEGAERVRYADTVGILYRQKIFDEIKAIKSHVDVDLEIHTHNDFGMAVANSIWAAEAGARYVDCTVGGVGERAGNCNFLQFMLAARACLGAFKYVDIGYLEENEKEIMGIIAYKCPSVSFTLDMLG